MIHIKHDAQRRDTEERTDISHRKNPVQAVRVSTRHLRAENSTRHLRGSNPGGFRSIERIGIEPASNRRHARKEEAGRAVQAGMKIARLEQQCRQ